MIELKESISIVVILAIVTFALMVIIKTHSLLINIPVALVLVILSGYLLSAVLKKS